MALACGMVPIADGRVKDTIKYGVAQAERLTAADVGRA